MPERYRRPPLSEKQVTEQVTDYLKLMHIPFFRNNVGQAKYTNKDGKERRVAYGEAGLPDYSIIIFHKGLPLAGYLELKREKGGKQSDE